MNGRKLRRLKENVAGYGFLTPSMVLMITFVVLPILISIYLSFCKYNGFKAPEWVGFQNYIDMWNNRDFRMSMKNTLIYVVATVPITIVISLVLAAVLAANFQNPFGEFTRGTMFIPVLCSATLAGTLFYYLFSSDAASVANSIVAMFGLDKINWLGERNTAMAVVCIVGIWKNVGYYLVIFYAGIMDVSKNLYEAASVDGASPIQQFFHITLPGIKPIMYLVVTLCIIAAFQVFDVTYVMTNGGPGNATISPVLLIYKQAFSSHKMGLASAMAIALAIIIFIVTMIQRALMEEKDGED